MPFTTKVWQDNASTPTDAAGFVDLEQRLSAYSEQVAASSPSVIEGFGHSLSVSVLYTMARELKATVQDYTTGGARAAGDELSNFGGHVRCLQQLDRRWRTNPDTYLYLAQSELALVWWGIVDLVYWGPSRISSIVHAFRTTISRLRQAIFYPVTDSTVVYTGTWTTEAALAPLFYAGGSSRYSPNVGDSFQINVPAHFPGGRVALQFLTYPDGNHGADWRIAVDGGAAAAWEARDIQAWHHGSTAGATGESLVSTYRTPSLAAGAHTIVVTMNAIEGNAHWAGWGVEPSPAATPNPLPVILVPTELREPAYTTWDSFPYNIAQGLGDADIVALNAAKDAMIAEFDERVVHVDIDGPVNKNTVMFNPDLVHLNAYGTGVVAETLLEALDSRFSLLPRGYLAIPFERAFWKASEHNYFLNSWVDFGGADAPVGVRRNPDGRVDIRGSVKSGSSATATVMNVEGGLGFRPRYPVQFAIDGNGTAGIGRLEANGDLKFIAGGSVTKTSFTFTYYGED